MFFHGAAKRASKSSKKCPRGGQNGLQEWPRRLQERPRSAPGAARSAPRAPQERSKKVKKGSKKVAASILGLGRPPGGSRERFWSDFGASGAHFRTMFRRFSTQFRPHARGHFLLSICSPCSPFCFAFLETSGLSACMFLKGSRRSGRKARREADSKRATRSHLKTPGEAAQRPSKGIKRSYWIAGSMLSLLLPLLPCSSSSCWRSGYPCSCCSRCSCRAWRTCSSSCDRASRSMIARFIFGAKSAECFERGAFFRKMRSPSSGSYPGGLPRVILEPF